MNRRDALKVFGSGALALGAGKAVDNVVLGYERNLHTQDLAAVAREDLAPAESYDRRVGGYRLLYQQDHLFVVEGAETRKALSVAEVTRERAARVDDEYGLDGALPALLRAVRALGEGAFRLEFHHPDSFFDRLSTGVARPFVADVLRGYRAADPDIVREFVGADPADPEATLRGLVDAFREHTDYDVPRYLAGTVTYNVLFRTVDLRDSLEHPVDFETLEAGDHVGMFCNEFAYRSLEAIHAVPAFEQTVPVVGAKVTDDRHRHVYTAVAGAIEEDGRLVLPMTFVDYTHTTLYDDFALTGVMGEGFDAYNRRHRATRISWSPYR